MSESRISAATFQVALFAMLLLMGIRVYHGFSFEEPLQYISSGDEQASLYAIWKYANGQDVFTDPTRSPYTMSYFNALFYLAYGNWISAWQDLLSLSDAWIPTIARSLSLLGVLTGWAGLTVAFRFICRAAGAPHEPVAAPMAALSAAIVFIGPLMGFWAFTVRPDVWAFVFEVFGVLVFLRTYDRNRMLAVIIAAVLFFVGWMFKQSTVGAVCAVGLFLLVERRPLPLVVYCAVFWGLCAVSILGGGEIYRQSLFFSKIELAYSPAHALAVWAHAAAKSLPVYAPLLYVFYAFVRYGDYRRRLLGDRICLFFLSGFAAATGIMFVLTLQDGSAENYTFTPTMFAAGLLIRGTVLAGGIRTAATTGRIWLGATGVHTVLCIMVIGGAVGVLDAAAKPHAEWTAARTCINKLPKPIFVEDTYLSLPWMTDSVEPFVLAHTYARARDLGVPHEKGGIGGRIEAGEFKTLALFTNQADIGYDGAQLDNYELQPEQCGSLFIWSRVEP